jgi:hypothetical protein
MILATCLNYGCPRPMDHPRLGLCSACAAYQRRTGRPRPEAFVGRPLNVKGVRPCCNCGRPTLRVRHGRCAACAKHMERRGCERPTEGQA